LAQRCADMSAGSTVQETAQAHMNRLDDMLNAENPMRGV